ncbi:MAG: hypothetical protein AAFY35_15400 [Pseudomonadota bacterium]
MSFSRRTVVFGSLALGLAACAGADPTASVLDDVSRNAIKVTGANVIVTRMGDTTTGRVVASDRVQELLESYARQNLVGQGTGTRNVNALIDIESVNVINGAQSILIGGESVMAGSLSLVDARSGQVVMPPRNLKSGGGGWVLGGPLAVAVRDEADTEVAQMSQRFVERSKILIFGKEE